MQILDCDKQSSVRSRCCPGEGARCDLGRVQVDRAGEPLPELVGPADVRHVRVVLVEQRLLDPLELRAVFDRQFDLVPREPSQPGVPDNSEGREDTHNTPCTLPGDARADAQGGTRDPPEPPSPSRSRVHAPSRAQHHRPSRP
jgi:hypothetical protein